MQSVNKNDLEYVFYYKKTLSPELVKNKVNKLVVFVIYFKKFEN